MKTYSSQQAADKVGIDRITLQRWLARGAALPQPLVEIEIGNGRRLRRWSVDDIEKLQLYVDQHKYEHRLRRNKGGSREVSELPTD